jgi:hypothetical protein
MCPVAKPQRVGSCPILLISVAGANIGWSALFLRKLLKFASSLDAAPSSPGIRELNEFPTLELEKSSQQGKLLDKEEGLIV